MSLVAAPVKVCTVPSPQSTRVALTVPSGSALVIDKVTVCPVLAEVSDGVGLTVGGRSVTVTVEEVEVLEPLLSVAVIVIVNRIEVAEPVEL